MLAASPELRGVAIADVVGQTLRASGEAIDMQSLTELAHKGRVALGAGQRAVIAFADGGDTVAVSFAASALVPAAMMDGVELVNTAGMRLAGTHD